MIIRQHKGCGGEVKKGLCLKCGKVFGRVARMTGKGIETVDTSTLPFSEDEYRQRLRQGQDIPWSKRQRKK